MNELLDLEIICFFSISQSTKLWSRPETRASRYGEGAYTEKAKDIINFQETVARAAEKRSKSLQFFCLQVCCKCVVKVQQFQTPPIRLNI